MSNETDRELLELAAKAAGVTLCVFGPTGSEKYGDSDGFGRHVPWNPLTDDGDALRLAVKLKIDINHDVKLGIEIVYAAARGTLWSQASEEKSGADPCVFTRRAIVRAAAEIGRAMQ